MARNEGAVPDDFATTSACETAEVSAAAQIYERCGQDLTACDDERRAKTNVSEESPAAACGAALCPSLSTP